MSPESSSRPERTLETLVDLVERSGFVAGAQEFISSAAGREADWVHNELADHRRCATLFLLKSPADSTVLCMDDGLGAEALWLSGRCRRVVTAHESPLLLSLRRHRSTDSGCRNMEWLRLDRTAPLPFDDATFDLVLLGRALENLEGLHFGHQRFFAELSRVLGPDGQILLTVDNRLDYRRLWKESQGGFDAPDDGDDPSTRPVRRLRYTRGQIAAFLRDGGFQAADVYAPYPDDGCILQLLALARRPALRPDRRRRSPFRSLLHRVVTHPTIFSRVAPVLCIVGGKPPRSRLLIDDLCDALDLVGDPLKASLSLSKTGMALAWSRRRDGGPVIVRIPYSQRGLERCSRNAIALEEASGNPSRSAAFKRCVPRLVASATVAGQMATAESLVEGTALRDCTSAAAEKAWPSLVRLLEELSSVTPVHREIENPRAETLIRERIARVREHVPPGSRGREVVGFLHEVEALLVESSIPLVPAHGDCNPGNVLVSRDSGEVVGLIDWDRGFDHEYPGFDLFKFALRDAAGYGAGSRRTPGVVRETYRKTLAEIARTQELPENYFQLLQIYYNLSLAHHHLAREFVSTRGRDHAFRLMRRATEIVHSLPRSR